MAADEVEISRVAAELVQVAISRSSEELTEKKSSGSKMSWPSSKEFTVESGQRAIEKTVQVQFYIHIMYVMAEGNWKLCTRT